MPLVLRLKDFVDFACQMLPTLAVMMMIKEHIDILSFASAVNMNHDEPLIGSFVCRIQFVDFMRKRRRLPTERLPRIKALVSRSCRNYSIALDNRPKPWDVAIARKLDPSLVRVGDDEHLCFGAVVNEPRQRVQVRVGVRRLVSCFCG